MAADGRLFARRLRNERDALLMIIGGRFADDELVLFEAKLDVDEDLLVGHEVCVCDGARRRVPGIILERR